MISGEAKNRVTFQQRACVLGISFDRAKKKHNRKHAQIITNY